MPANSGVTQPITHQILEFLALYPRRRYRPRQVAEALHRPTQPIANELARLHRRGLINKTNVPVAEIPVGTSLRGQTGAGVIAFYRHRKVSDRPA